jgi:outer membrane protein insertion porin family
VGANYMVLGNIELIFPLAREIGLKGALFFDIGKAWGVDAGSGIQGDRGIKFGAGPGIRWFSPFGPIRLDLGFNLRPKGGEKGHVFDFTGGTGF